jgi:hypothetical protein
MSPDKLSEFVNQSGFPLQIGISNMVDRTTNAHGWRVLYSEHSWKNTSDGTEGFVDLALANRYGTSVIVMECKRVLDTSWVFLQPGARITNMRHAKAWVTRTMQNRFTWFDWFDLALDPASAESSYCVVPGQDARSKPMLERVAADVLSATEALAWEDKGVQERRGDAVRMYFSVVATTAQLKVCVFDPDRITLNDGKLAGGDFHEVPYVRFRKQLSTRTPKISDNDWDQSGRQAIVKAKEHTVFVVNADALLGFLSNFDIDNGSLRQLH